MAEALARHAAKKEVGLQQQNTLRIHSPVPFLVPGHQATRYVQLCRAVLKRDMQLCRAMLKRGNTWNGSAPKRPKRVEVGSSEDIRVAEVAGACPPASVGARLTASPSASTARAVALVAVGCWLGCQSRSRLPVASNTASECWGTQVQ